MVIEKDLGKTLSNLVATLSHLGLNVDDLRSSIHELEKSQQFLISIKSLKILEKILTQLTNLKELLEKSELKDFLTQVTPIIKGISSDVKELGIEFSVCTVRLSLLLTIVTFISMVSSITSLAILYQFQILNITSFLSLTFITLFIIMATLLSLYLKLLLVLTLEPLAILPSLTASLAGLILHPSASLVIIILTIINITLLVALLRFLVLQANTYKIAISIATSIYHMIEVLKTIIENKLRAVSDNQRAIPSESLFIKVYGNEASELIKYTTDVNKVR
ncbi:MAG: hypothetical protein QXT53_01580 [Ignisphaera sp.]